MPGDFILADARSIMRNDEFATEIGIYDGDSITATVKVIFDSPGDVLLAELGSTSPTARVVFADWPTVEDHVSQYVSIDGTDYRLNSALSIGDGTYWRLGFEL